MSPNLRPACLQILFFGVLITHISAQPQHHSTHLQPRLAFDRIGLADGLPNEYVNRVAQDRFGFMWFATQDGLCRYDGREFKIFKSIPGGSTSMASSEIQVVFADSRGVLWVGAKGLQRFNFEPENFARIGPPHFTAGTPSGSGAASDHGTRTNKLQYLTKICEDNSGMLWFGTFDQALFKFDPVSQQLTAADLGVKAPTSFGGTVICSLSASRSDTIWITSTGHQLTALIQAGHF
jgi:ligand-binding sensor domain-containing protein